VVRSASEAARFRAHSLTRRAWFAGCVWLLSLTLPIVSGCRSKPRQNASAANQAASAPGAALAHNLAPLSAKSWLIDLDVPGFGKAALAVPLAATEPRPIVIALHGGADRPEWACGAWRGIAGPTPFVLCPRGVQRADFAAPDFRYTFGPTDAVAAELRAGLASLKREFAAYVAPGAVVFAGFELGADRVAAIAQQEPTFFARLALIAPAPSSWPSSQAALFGREGGERVLFACGPAERASTDFKAVLTRRGGADAQAVFLGDRRAELGAATVSLLRGHWAWLSAPVTRLAPPENLAGNSLTAKRPGAPHSP
jgi:hypothetical protein